MPILESLLTGGLFDFAGKVLDRLVTDPAAKLQYAQKLADMANNKELALLAADTDLAKLQAQINLADAQSKNWFQSNWRPFVGWVCGVALAFDMVIRPFAIFVSNMLGYHIEYPQLDLITLMGLLTPMLGLGAVRTIEKLNGVDTK